MDTYQLLHESVASGPEQLDIITRAFERAWAEVGRRYPYGERRNIARECLAMIVIDIAGHGILDEEQLRRIAIEAMVQPLS